MTIFRQGYRASQPLALPQNSSLDLPMATPTLPVTVSEGLLPWRTVWGRGGAVQEKEEGDELTVTDAASSRQEASCVTSRSVTKAADHIWIFPLSGPGRGGKRGRWA